MKGKLDFGPWEQIFNGDEFYYNIFEYPGVLVTPIDGCNEKELAMRPRSLVPLILLVLVPVASAGEQEKTLFTEPFAEKLAGGDTGCVTC